VFHGKSMCIGMSFAALGYRHSESQGIPIVAQQSQGGDQIAIVFSILVTIVVVVAVGVDDVVCGQSLEWQVPYLVKSRICYSHCLGYWLARRFGSKTPHVDSA
jgi:hypothetical protein